MTTTVERLRFQQRGLAGFLRLDVDAASPARFKKEILRVGRWVHPVTGQPIDMDRARLQHLADNTNRWMSLGHDVWFPAGHSVDPLKNLGTWEPGSMQVDGDSLTGIVDVPEDDIAEKIGSTITGVSADIKLGQAASNGEWFDEVIVHVCATPCPVIPGQHNFVRLAIESEDDDEDEDEMDPEVAQDEDDDAGDMPGEAFYSLAKKAGLGDDEAQKLCDYAKSDAGQMHLDEAYNPYAVAKAMKNKGEIGEGDEANVEHGILRKQGEMSMVEEDDDDGEDSELSDDGEGLGEKGEPVGEPNLKAKSLPRTGEPPVANASGKGKSPPPLPKKLSAGVKLATLPPKKPHADPRNRGDDGAPALPEVTKDAQAQMLDDAPQGPTDPLIGVKAALKLPATSDIGTIIETIRAMDQQVQDAADNSQGIAVVAPQIPAVAALSREQEKEAMAENKALKELQATVKQLQEKNARDRKRSAEREIQLAREQSSKGIPLDKDTTDLALDMLSSEDEKQQASGRKVLSLAIEKSEFARKASMNGVSVLASPGQKADVEAKKSEIAVKKNIEEMCLSIGYETLERDEDGVTKLFKTPSGQTVPLKLPT